MDLVFLIVKVVGQIEIRFCFISVDALLILLPFGVTYNLKHIVNHYLSSCFDFIVHKAFKSPICLYQVKAPHLIQLFSHGLSEYFFHVGSLEQPSLFI